MVASQVFFNYNQTFEKAFKETIKNYVKEEKVKKVKIGINSDFKDIWNRMSKFERSVLLDHIGIKYPNPYIEKEWSDVPNNIQSNVLLQYLKMNEENREKTKRHIKNVVKIFINDKERLRKDVYGELENRSYIFYSDVYYISKLYTKNLGHTGNRSYQYLLYNLLVNLCENIGVRVTS